MFQIQQNISLQKQNKTKNTKHTKKERKQTKKKPPTNHSSRKFLGKKPRSVHLKFRGGIFPPPTSWALCLPFWLPPDLKFPFKADKHVGKLEREKNPLWIDGSGWRKRSYSNESITSCVQEKRTKCTLHICPNCSTCLHNLKASLIT